MRLKIVQIIIKISKCWLKCRYMTILNVDILCYSFLCLYLISIFFLIALCRSGDQDKRNAKGDKSSEG